MSRKRVVVVSLQRLGETIATARITDAWARRDDVASVTLVHWDETEQAAALLPGVSERIALPRMAHHDRLHARTAFTTSGERLDTLDRFDVVINTSTNRFACLLAPELLREGGQMLGPWIDDAGTQISSHPCVAYLGEWGSQRLLNVFAHQDLYTLAAGADLATPGRLDLPSDVDDKVTGILRDVAGAADPFVVHVHSSDPAADGRAPFEAGGWRDLITQLRRDLGYAVFVVGRPCDAEAIERVAQSCGATPAPWSLARTTALLRRSAGLISVDTVSIHLAARVGCPAIVLRQGPAGGMAFAPGPHALLVDPRDDIAEPADVARLTRAFCQRVPLDAPEAAALAAKLRVRETFRDGDAFIGARTPPWLPAQPDDVAEDLSDGRWRQAWRASWSSQPAPAALSRFVCQPHNAYDARRLQSVIASEHRLGAWLRAPAKGAA